ncbi:MAG TPA: gamma-glutamyltransferase [Nocardioidaceae bacterium]|nr:gamma-glutamyltransferase [Nocardioidaceae bacterium]
MPPAPAPLGQLKTAALGTAGAVTSSHPAISAVGAQALADGGNAVDATLAMAATGWMTLPGQCGVGGDAFALVREPDGRAWTVNGSGFGPDGGTPDFFRGRGLDAIPLTGALSVAVPGALAAVITLGRRATRSLDELWQPAIRAAERGVPATAKNIADISGYAGALAADPDARAVFLPGGRLPRLGELIRQPDLARTLRRLAPDPHAFYTGWFADRALAALVDAGAAFGGEEWALGSEAPAVPALEGSYAGLRLRQTPLPSAGWMVVHQAALLDGILGQLPQLGAEAIHWFAGAARASFQHRFDHCASDNDHWREALAEAAVRRGRRAVSRGLPVEAVGVANAGDTTSTVCVDADGLAVSFIHSLAFTYGARTMVPGTGVLLNNRLGRGAYLIEGHPNEVRPRRKPMHTLNAWLLEDTDGVRAVGNCPGGDGQVQWNMQVISHLVDHHDDPQRAVSLPRVTTWPGSDADAIGSRPVLRCEEGVPEATLQVLERWGHDVERVPVQRGGPGGSALAITRDAQDGVLHAAADPRMEGTALAL